MARLPIKSSDAPSSVDLAKCVHCGLCLPNCPTYLATGQETESPRGRLHLISALDEGRIESTDTYAQHINLCLVCRACENVCPSGVPFGRIMEAARSQLVETRPGSARARILRWLVFRQLMPRPSRLRMLARLLRLYQRSGLQRLVRQTGLLKVLPSRLELGDAQLPRLPRQFFEPNVRILPAIGPRRYRVGFFAGCVMPYLYSEVHEATLRVLRRNGCEVFIAADQVCCGALNVHSGERGAAREMARRNIQAFMGAGLDAIVVNAAGCGSTLKEYDELLAAEAPEQDRVTRFTHLVQDVHEFLAAMELVPPTVPVPRRVTLQESYHLVHAQRIKAAPRDLLAQVPGLVLVDMAHPDLCCGSAGVYSLVQPEMSSEILNSRMLEIRDTAADTVVTSNPGCLLQLEHGVRRSGLKAEVKHVIQILDEAYGGAG